MKILTTVFLIIFAIRIHAQIYDQNGDVVQTFVGSGIPGYIDGFGQQTEFSNPNQIVADTVSNLYVWDNGNHVIRKITASGTVSTFIGGGSQFSGYGTNVSLSLYSIGSMAIDHADKIWISASFNYPYLLGIDNDGYVNIENGALPNFTTSSGMCFDSVNNLYYSGGFNVYKYNTKTAACQVFAGSGTGGHLDGVGIFTEFTSPRALVCDQADNIYVYDNGGIRKIDQSQNVTTITNSIAGVPCAVDNKGNIIGCYANAGASFIFKLTPATNIVLYAGTPNISNGAYTNGIGNLARFNNPSDLCISGSSIFIADTGNQRIRQISFNPQTEIVSAANLKLGTFAGLTILGTIGRTYQIQSSADMVTWKTNSTILLTSSPYLWIDQNPIAGSKFYRAFLLP